MESGAVLLTKAVGSMTEEAQDFQTKS